MTKLHALQFKQQGENGEYVYDSVTQITIILNSVFDFL